MLWFPVALDTPNVPYANPFVLRTYDVRDRLPQTEIGTVQDFREEYDGPTPINLPGHVCGSAEDWENGILYSDFLEGVPGCSCPAPIYMPNVNTVRNDDGSLTIAPTTGNVEAHINLAHSNAWEIQQVFNTANQLVPALEARGMSGQLGPYLAVRRGSGTLAWTVGPKTAEPAAIAELLTSAGTIAFSVDTDGNLVLTNNSTGKTLAINIGSFTVIHAVDAEIRSNPGYLKLLGDVFASRAPGGNYAPYGGADFAVVKTANTGDLSFVVGSDATLGNQRALEVFISPTTTNNGSLNVNVQIGADFYACGIVHRTGTFGLCVLQDSGGVSANPALFVGDDVGIPLAGFFGNGKLFSDLAQTPVVAGTVSHKLALYDSTGSLIGYIPVLNAL